MRVLFVQQDHVSPPGPVGEAFVERGYDVDEFLVVPAEQFHKPCVTVVFPDPRDYDVVVPMGAPWSVYDDDAVGTWVKDEIEFVREAHDAHIPVLGICFGGQAMSVALGGGVTRATGWEIGWAPVVTARPELVPPGPWFQFHKDAMVLPPGAVEIACSTASSPVQCSQAWMLGRTLAVQFHPELTAEVLELWLGSGGAAVAAGEGVDVDGLRARTASGAARARERTHALVTAFLETVATTPV